MAPALRTTFRQLHDEHRSDHDHRPHAQAAEQVFQSRVEHRRLSLLRLLLLEPISSSRRARAVTADTGARILVTVSSGASR